MRKIPLTISLSFVAAMLLCQPSSADKVCLKFNKSTSKLTKKTVTSGNCARGYIEVVDTARLTGATGAAGTNGAAGSAGADGKIAIWGDGSNGDLVVTDGSELSHTKQYDDITIPAGATVYARSGQTIKCTGTFTNNGTLFIESGSGGGYMQDIDGTTYFPSVSLPSLGLSYVPASTGECATIGNNAEGGNGGLGFGGTPGKYPTKIASNASAGSGAGAPVGAGGNAGGAIAINCKGGIINSSTGIINAYGANGQSGGGGGGGGIIIFASNGSVTNAGAIDVHGGNGGASTTKSCPGGGAGGGFVHFISPSVSNTGSVNVSGGTIGTQPIAISATLRCGGGGGGASYGAGGGAHRVTTSETCSAGNSAGADGGTYTTNPAGSSVEALLF